MKRRYSTMSSSAYSSTILLPFLVAVIFVFGANGYNESKLPKQPNNIKRHIIKSFQTKDGDIIDCVDIYKQPAFDHPLLKNHAIQMKPEGIPQQLLSKISNENISPQIFAGTIQCPEGYVPIERTSEEDLAMHKYFKPLESGPNSDGSYGFYESTVYYNGKNFGGSGTISIWNPGRVSTTQTSSADIRILSGPSDNQNAIVAGWVVRPSISGDQQTRFFTYWTADSAKNTGCFNTLCPGYVHISRSWGPGLPLTPLSIYGGQQYIFQIIITRDNTSKNWWLIAQNEVIGYWPENIFNSLREGGDNVTWGGHVASPKDEASAPMGSGHFPSEGYQKAAHIRQIKVLHDGNFFDPSENTDKVSTTNSYDVLYQITKDEKWGHYLYFGGPGGYKE